MLVLAEVTQFESLVGVNPWTALFTFCNMIITFLLLKKFLFKPVKKMIDERQKEIDDMYAAAEESKTAAAKLQADYEEHLSEARAERDEILRDAVSRARKRETEIVAGAKSDAAAILTKAEADIAQEKKKALNEVKNEISSISVSIAEAVVEREITEADHQRLVEEFIGKLGETDD